MGPITVERIGGLAGFGGHGARIHSRGQIHFDSLSGADQRALERLFAAHPNSETTLVRDGFCYRLSSATVDGSKTIEVPEALVPKAVAACVKDELS
jgi:hypothetical protein